VPTIQGIESYQHRIIPTALNAQSGWYSAVSNAGTQPNHGGGAITFDTGIKRTAEHVCSLKVVPDGVTNTNVRRTIASTIVVGSAYIRVDSNPSGAIKLFNMALSAGVATVGMNTSGQVTAKVGSGTQNNGSTNWADAKWHRIDWKADTSTGTATLDIIVDGVETITQATLALASANMTTVMTGDNTVGGPATVYYSDLVWSVTAGDYPLGDHICLMSAIDGEGTHAQGSGAFQTDTGGTSGYGAAVDDAWDGTTPELSQTGEDHVKQTVIDTSGYLEFTVADPPPNYTVVWAAQPGFLLAALDSATLDNVQARMYHSSTLLAQTGSIDPSISATEYTGYRIYPTAAPSGGWSGTTLAAVRLRFGFSSDVTPNPVMNAACVEWVAPWPQAAAGPLIRNEVPFIGSNPLRIGPI